MKPTSVGYTYDQRDLILYALSLGCTRHDLQYVYEGHPNFSSSSHLQASAFFRIVNTSRLQDRGNRREFQSGQFVTWRAVLRDSSADSYTWYSQDLSGDC